MGDSGTLRRRGVPQSTLDQHTQAKTSKLMFMPPDYGKTIGNFVSSVGSHMKIGDAFLNMNTESSSIYQSSSANIFVDGAKILFWLNVVLAFAHLATSISVFIWYWFVIPKMSDSILTMDPTLYDGSVFAVTLQLLSTYKLVIVLIIPTFVAGLFHAFKAFSIPYQIITRMEQTNSRVSIADLDWGMYLDSVEEGVFGFTWVYLFFGVGAFTWTIASICGITNIFLIVVLVGCIFSVIYTGWLHEARNRSLDDLNREGAVTTLMKQQENNYVSSILQWKFWDAYIFGGFIHILYWTIIFAYFGLKAASAPTILTWWEWTVPFVSFFFFVLFCIVIGYYTSTPDVEERGSTIADVHFQRHVNKEIWINLIIALCSQLVLWLTFGGMLSTN
jgi:hypothetical protein